jgi:CheY-like chemotaxis protein
MPAEVRDHIFEPFYTTKDRGKGSGLGLSTVYGIVKQTEGWIDLESAPGQGTTFRLYFPAHEEMMPEILPSETPPDLPHGQETILVVEDEETVRHFTAKVLESLGYNVLQASNGGEALLVFETHSGTIDVVLTDIVMPLMNGRELVRRLRETGREFNVMYMTGFSEDALEEEGRAVLLQKPYTREGLARMLRQVLDQGAGAGSRQS